MARFLDSKVYKLVNSIDDLIYIGSTTQPLSKRFSDHKANAKFKPGPVHRHLNNIGWDTVRIILIETVICYNKDQLNQREQHYIDVYKPELNKKSAFTDCPHGRQHNVCVECHGSSICIHNRQKASCKDCHGARICIHNKQKQTCKDCHGSGICIHNRVKQECKECSPKYCPLCDIITGKSTYKQHTKTVKHIYNFINY